MRKYIGKDYVHEGCGLLLDEDIAWKKIAYAARKNIQRAQSADIRIEKVPGTPTEMEILRLMWYEPKDPNIPTYLRPDDHMFIAYDNGNVPIGCCVLLEVGNHLFLNNLAGSASGKELRIQDYLLWHCVEHFADSKYKYIDVGVSYRKSLYKFFEKWKVVGYPVIFYKPAFAPTINANPFDSSHYKHDRNERKMERASTKIEQLASGKQFTFVPDATYAKNILRSLNDDQLDATLQFPEIGEKPCFVDLSALFSVQFGALLFNVKISDEDLWNIYGCLDFFKREVVFTQLDDELEKLDAIIDSRKKNWDTLNQLFSLDELHVERRIERIPKFFYFNSPVNKRFSEKLTEFNVEYAYDAQTNLVGLPVHQNLNKSHLEYLYGIYRGVLNLCSEWAHTDTVGAYKKV